MCPIDDPAQFPDGADAAGRRPPADEVGDQADPLPSFSSSSALNSPSRYDRHLHPAYPVSKSTGAMSQD
jgi:hypothetical protein